MTLGAVVIGSGNIGTDLLMKIRRLSSTLEIVAMAGVDPGSDGLARARRLGVASTDRGIDGLVEMAEFADAAIVFDATSAGAHRRHAAVAAEHGKLMVDLTPAAIGPYVVPVVNLDENLGAGNVNMVTCGGQATIPIVAAISAVAPVTYAEVVASIASKSAARHVGQYRRVHGHDGPRHRKGRWGTEGKGDHRAQPGRAPTCHARHHFLPERARRRRRRAGGGGVGRANGRGGPEVRAWLPAEAGRPVRCSRLGYLPALERPFEGVRTSVFLEVTGAGHYLPAYAGNLDIMTSAALRTAERMAELRGWA